MDDAFVVALVVGGFIGLLVGRTWAEVFRARFDMQQTWRRRSIYREGEQRRLLPALVIAVVLLTVYLLGA